MYLNSLSFDFVCEILASELNLGFCQFFEGDFFAIDLEQSMSSNEPGNTCSVDKTVIGH